MIVFTKTDLASALKLHEIKSLMRLDQLIQTSKQSIVATTFYVGSEEKTAEICNWCLKFCLPKMPINS